MLLAGDVTAALDASGVLIIRGDVAANSIELAQQANGDWKVTGNGTTINGGKSAFVASGVLAIDCNLEEGNNTTKITKGSLDGAVILDGGFGNDAYNVNNLNAGSFLIFDSGGNNTANLSKVSTDDFIKVLISDLNDNVTASDCTAGGLFQVSVGNGTNNVTLKKVTAALAVQINGGADTDNVTINNTVSQSQFIQVNAGNGANTVKVNTANANGADSLGFFQINGGVDRDVVTANMVSARGGFMR